MRRVVSLVPSITETLIGWGVEPVAVTRFCEVPGLPTVGGTKNPDVQAIIDLRPEMVFMDKEENRLADADALTGAGLQVVVTDVRHLADVNPALERLAEAVGLSRPSPPAPPPEVEGVRRSVFVPIWRRPWMSVGGQTYGSTLLSAAGFDNVFAASSDPYPTVDLEAAAGHRPDLVLAPSEPYPFSDRHRVELEAVAPVVFVDGRDLFWWGIRTPAARARLAGMAQDLAGA